MRAQADRFAGAFLMPRSSFLRDCPRRMNMEHFRELKWRWKVALAALIHRAHDLRVFTDATASRAYMYLNKLGYRTHGEPDEPAPEPPNLLPSALRAVSGQPLTLADDLCLSEQELRALVEGREHQRGL